MKVFIVFLALVLLNVNMMVFQDDYLMYENLQKSVKVIADDCAYGSAMLYDEESYGEGFLKYDTEEATKYIQHVIDKYNIGTTDSLMKDLHYKAYFFDDFGQCQVLDDGLEKETFGVEYPYIFIDDQGYEEKVSEPMVKVVISVETADVFRFDYLYSPLIIRSSSYANSPH